MEKQNPFKDIQLISEDILKESMGSIPVDMPRGLRGGRSIPNETPVSKTYKNAVIGTPGFNGYDQALGNGQYAYEQEEDVSNIEKIINELESELDGNTHDGRSGLLVLGKLRKKLNLI